tara:strand:+ start:1039 stop:2172 length:1134 start_codon:yes stop_codon:yes gene_type:complete
MMIHFIRNKNYNLKKVPERLFLSPNNYSEISNFHKTLGNKKTPLHKLPRLAKYLGVGSILLKDESHRFGLNAFKALGASYAMDKQIKKFPQIKVFCTATDGNHGRAVAWMAKKLKRKAYIYMPRGTVSARIKAIEEQGAKVIVTNHSYDITVKMAEKRVKEGNNSSEYNAWSLIQDTAWDGYEEIPIDIMKGYWTQIHEITKQTEGENIDIVFLQLGVGSWAASVVMYILDQWEKTPFFIGVEPHSANCLFESIKTGHQVSVQSEMTTNMAGLNCGSISTLAWKILNNAILGSISISDEVSEKGMQTLASPLGDDPKIISGESGASSLGALVELCRIKEYKNFKKKINLNKSSKVLIINTEGNTDPLNYKRVIDNKS